MRPRYRSLRVVAALALVLLVSPARADDQPPEPSPAAAEMLKSMREKGIISEDEYEDLFRRQARFEAEQRAASSLPGWLRGWTFGGDLRLRYDREDFGDAPQIHSNEVFPIGNYNVDVTRIDTGSGTVTSSRDRYRLRARLGAEKRLSDEFVSGFRIATSQSTSYGSGASVGGSSGVFTRNLNGDPRSNNTTLGGYFEPKGIYLDRAYLQWNPSFAKSLKLDAGKFGNPFLGGRNPAEHITWDPDIQPEGVGLKYGFEALDGALWLGTHAGYFMIDEVGSATVALPPVTAAGTAITIAPRYDDRDPFMAGIQQEIDLHPSDRITANGRVSYYSLQHLNTGFVATINDLGNNGSAVDSNPLYVVLAPSDPLFQSGRSRGRLDEVVFDGFVDFRPWAGSETYVRPFGLMSSIVTAPKDDKAWALGAEFGNPNTFKLSAAYTRIERDGTIALFTDSDLFDGLTNVRGWFVSLEARLASYMRLRGSFMKSRINNDECLVAQGSIVSECDFGLTANPSLVQEFTKTARDRTRYQIDLMVDF